MKKLLVLFSIISISWISMAQTEECRTEIPEYTTFEMASPYGDILEVRVLSREIPKFKNLMNNHKSLPK